MVKSTLTEKGLAMMTNKSPTLSPTPNFLTALKGGFDVIANHISLILFPIALDLFLWLGPRWRITPLLDSLLKELFNGVGAAGVQSQTLTTVQEIWTMLSERFTLFAALRSYPVGIPSLMAGRLPLETPNGSPLTWEVYSWGGAILLWLLLTGLGLLFGTLYFSVIAQMALSGEMHWRDLWQRWPQAAVQSLFLALFWVGLLIVISFPFTCLISLAGAGGMTTIQCAFLVYSGFLLWILFPLIFSPHGIFVNQLKMLPSIKTGMRLSRMTFSGTALFFMAAFLLSKGLDMLWLTPNENSWLTLIGVAGHAFITTGLLAASFIYYRDADQWAQRVSG
jgi:hypothetical protein